MPWFLSQKYAANVLTVPRTLLKWSAQQKPHFLLVVDTEEEFNWHELPEAHAAHNSKNIQHLTHLIDLCQKYEITPTLILTYAVMQDAAAVMFLRNAYKKQQVVLGTHLHSWHTPPMTAHDKRVFYASGLPYPIEYQKMQTLTQQFVQCFDHAPTIFKAGRYGFGNHTVHILNELGYTIDLSVNARYNFSADGGMDFRHLTPQPYVFTQYPHITAVPLYGGFVGQMPSLGSLVSPITLRALSKFNMCTRVRLSPEGHTPEQIQQMLSHAMPYGVVQGALHSSSFLEGGSPYSMNTSDKNMVQDTLAQMLQQAQQLGYRFGTIFDAVHDLRTHNQRTSSHLQSHDNASQYTASSVPTSENTAVTTHLKENDTAPAFSAPDQHGQLFHFQPPAANNTVLYFYPKDDTPGCTIEANDFSAMQAQFAAAGCTVVGVSADDTVSHASFCQKYNLNLTLVSDTTHEQILQPYGVWGERTMYGKKFMGIHRTTFLIDAQGIIRKVWKNVKVDGHAEAVLTAAQQLNQQQKAA